MPRDNWKKEDMDGTSDVILRKKAKSRGIQGMALNARCVEIMIVIN